MRSLASAGWRGTALVAAVTALGALVLIVAGSPVSRTHATATSMYITPASQTVSETESEVSVDIGINDVAGMGAWEFALRYDPDVLEYASAQSDSAFIGQAGPPVCQLPIVDEDEGIVRLACGTFGSTGGASGSGNFATIKFAPKDSGSSPLVFTKLEIADPFANSISAAPATGMIRVLGQGESEPSDPEPTPTVDSTLLTPTPIPGAQQPEGVDDVDPNTGAVGRPGSGATGGSSSPRSGVAGRNASRGNAGNSNAGNSNNGNSSAADGGSPSGEGFPVAGYGVAQEEPPAWQRNAGIMLGALGVLAVTGGLAFGRMHTARSRKDGA